jgi:hypothetical protein
MKNKSSVLIILILAVSVLPLSAAQAWKAENVTNSVGESTFYTQTYEVVGVGQTDKLGSNATIVKTFTIGCSEGLLEILLYEHNIKTDELLYMGKSTQLQISIDNSKSFSVKVKEKAVANVISVVNPKPLYKKLANSKQVKIVYKIGGTSWVGRFKTIGLNAYSESFSRYGCTL